MSFQFITCTRLAILNRTNSPQYLPAGCSVMAGPGTGFDPQAPYSNVPPNCWLVFPPNQVITVPDVDVWFSAAPEWTLALEIGYSNFYDKTILPPSSAYFAAAIVTDTFPPGSYPSSISYWPAAVVISAS
jgi:hypothetical protein